MPLPLLLPPLPPWRLIRGRRAGTDQPAGSARPWGSSGSGAATSSAGAVRA